MDVEEAINIIMAAGVGDEDDAMRGSGSAVVVSGLDGIVVVALLLLVGVVVAFPSPPPTTTLTETMVLV